MGNTYTRRYNAVDDGKGNHQYASDKSRKLCHESLVLLGKTKEMELLDKNIELLEHHHLHCKDSITRNRCGRVIDYLEKKKTDPKALFSTALPARFK